MEPVDPPLEATYRKATELVGIGGAKNELVRRLVTEDGSSLQQFKIISIVGFGGLGKTTLANALPQDLKGKFDCHFFVSVSFKPDVKKIFKNILVQLDQSKYSHIDEAWELKLLIDKIKEFLEKRRYIFMLYILSIVKNKYFSFRLTDEVYAVMSLFNFYVHFTNLWLLDAYLYKKFRQYLFTSYDLSELLEILPLSHLKMQLS